VPKCSEQAELVRQIADQLKSWNGSFKQERVFAEINSAIKRLENPDLLHHLSRVIGSRRKSRERAKIFRVTLNQLEEQLAAIGHTFHIVISPENQVGLWNPKQTIGEIHNAFYEKLSKGDFRFERQKLHLAAAFEARLLMKNLSTQKPTIPSVGSGSFCTIASLLFEAVSGEHARNLISACRHIYHLPPEHI
jgi:hypothetical protein